jgi:hypothetical protein
MIRKRATLTSATLVVAWLLATAAAPAFVGLELLGLSSPVDVVRLIDALTHKDSATTLDVKLGETVGQGKLLVARTQVEVALERTSRNWRGPVSVHMTLPSTITYTLDLTSLRPEHIRIDAARGLVVVAMPALEVEDVTPMLTELKAEDTYKGARFRRLDGDASRSLENTMLKEDYQTRARIEGEDRLLQVHEQARTALQDLLRTLLRPSCPGVQVRVE